MLNIVLSTLELTKNQTCPRSPTNLRPLASHWSPRYGMMSWVPSLPSRLHKMRPIMPVAPKTVATRPLNDDRPPVPRAARAESSTFVLTTSLPLRPLALWLKPLLACSCCRATRKIIGFGTVYFLNSFCEISSFQTIILKQIQTIPLLQTLLPSIFLYKNKTAIIYSL